MNIAVAVNNTTLKNKTENDKKIGIDFFVKMIGWNWEWCFSDVKYDSPNKYSKNLNET